jgi:hypothetical protein
VEIDHVILLVDDLATGHDWMHTTHGLESVPGGRHQGHGTANRIVPLGATYLELMAVVDLTEAGTSEMGRWAMRRARPTPRPAALCLRTDDAEAVAARLDTEPVEMSRVRPDGSTLSWRLVGASAMFGGATSVFFIQWDGPGTHPGAMAAEHRVTPTGGMSLVLAGEHDDLERRLGRHGLPLTVEDGPPGVISVTVGTTGGPITLR